MSQHDKRIHNLVYGFDCDGLPAPSDYELAAADRANAIRDERTAVAGRLNTLITACERFSAAHGRCTDAECSDASVDPQDWAEFDRAVLAACDDSWTREALLQARDARDLRDTQQDALI